MSRLEVGRLAKLGAWSIARLAPGCDTVSDRCASSCWEPGPPARSSRIAGPPGPPRGLRRQGPERARRFLGKKSTIPLIAVNARNGRAVVRAARGCHLLVNASPAVFNEIALRAALRLRAHYLDLSTHMTRRPFKAEQLAYDERFAEKQRAAVITAGVSPGLTNLLAARGAEMLDKVEAVHIRLYEEAESDTPFRNGRPTAGSTRPCRGRAWCATGASDSRSGSASANGFVFPRRSAR